MALYVEHRNERVRIRIVNCREVDDGEVSCEDGQHFLYGYFAAEPDTDSWFGIGANVSCEGVEGVEDDAQRILDETKPDQVESCTEHGIPWAKVEEDPNEYLELCRRRVMGGPPPEVLQFLVSLFEAKGLEPSDIDVSIMEINLGEFLRSQDDDDEED